MVVEWSHTSGWEVEMFTGSGVPYLVVPTSPLLSRQSVSNQINALVRIKNDLDTYSRKTIYNSYISCNLNYCCTVWMFTNRGNLKKLDKLNRRALRMVYNDYTSDYDALLRQSDTLDVHKLCLKTLAVEMFKIKSCLSPVYMRSLFIPSDPVYMLRDTNTFLLPSFKTKRYGYHSMSYIGSKLWHDIDASIKDCDIKTFKSQSQIKAWLHNHHNVINSYF